FFDDAVFGDWQGAGLGGHDDEVVICDQVAGRAQAVTVEQGADLASVGEGDGGGAVPGFHHGRVVFVEGAAVGVHSGLLFPGFGDHDHHGMCQRVAGHNQEFQAVVEGGGV